MITEAVVGGRWAYLIPHTAIVLWVGAVLAVPLAALSATVMVLVDRHAADADYRWASAAALIGILALVAATVHVGRSFARIHAVARERCRRHNVLVDLFAVERPDLGRVVVVPDGRLFAYSLPCLISGRIVLSSGVLDRLDEESLAAVLAHERAHLAARHHLILQLATAITAAFPRVAPGLPKKIAQLIEMAADCSASRAVGRQPAMNALRTLAHMTIPPGVLGAGGRAVVLRLARLRSGRDCCARSLSVGNYAAAATLLLLPAMVVLVNQSIDLCLWMATL
ncbi:M56 family metallopeptidase [Herbidospora sp. RD11066]